MNAATFLAQRPSRPERVRFAQALKERTELAQKPVGLAPHDEDPLPRLPMRAEPVVARRGPEVPHETRRRQETDHRVAKVDFPPRRAHAGRMRKAMMVVVIPFAEGHDAEQPAIAAVVRDRKPAVAADAVADRWIQ